MRPQDSLWYKDAIIYELHVRSYFDSSEDGIGDFRGLTQKLDYLEDLGITAIWVLPFYPSPLKDDGYDIADYVTVNSYYGSLADFKLFLEEAHRRNIRVITELVINHTSDQHPWFQRARHSPSGSPERDFYVWSDTPEKYSDASIMFPDFETSNWAWDPVARQYYWHRFYSHQPDLNYDNPLVWDAIIPVVDFWFELGVDGMRLDAVPYLFEREGTSCEHLTETHAFLAALRKHIDQKYPNRMLLAEANAWPEEAVRYFGNGDECHMVFHFPLMPRLFMALHQEDRFPIIDIIAQTPGIPESAQWCLFLRNHDELTLALVTDEERDYMYRAYAQDVQAKIFIGIRHRLAPLLTNNRRRIEMMNALLFSLPGTPVVYYGDEIGMGDNIYLGDRDGVRTPMQWSADKNAGFSRANPQKLFLPIIIDPEYHYEAVNVETQQGNPSSLLWWMKRIIALRKQHKPFGRGTIEFLEHTNSKVLSFIRSYQDEHILVVINLSRFVQYIELDLHQMVDWIPEELFGGSLFPAIQKGRYPLTLGPHGFYWFSLHKSPQVQEGTTPLAKEPIPEFPLTVSWDRWIQGHGRADFEDLLPDYLYRRNIVRLNRMISTARIEREARFQIENETVLLVIVRVDYLAGLPETVPILLTFIESGQEEALLLRAETVALARVTGSQQGIIGAGLASAKLVTGILQAIMDNRRFVVEDGEIAAFLVPGLPLDSQKARNTPPTLMQSERNTLSIVFGQDYVLRVLRKVEPGTHPDVEVSRFLVEQQNYTHVAPVVGTIELRPTHDDPIVLAVLHKYIPNQGTAWQFVVHQLSKFFEDLAARTTEQLPVVPVADAWLEDTKGPGQILLNELLVNDLDNIRLLGQRTGEMHQALANTNVPAFAPASFNKGYQRSLYQSMRLTAVRLHERLQRNLYRLPEQTLPMARRFLQLHDRLQQKYDQLLLQQIGGMRIRTHGDYHLGQLLFTGNDFIVTDFDGQPFRTISDRRVKRSPFRDVATMLRSFDYAATSVLLGLPSSVSSSHGVIREEDRPRLQRWADAWNNQITSTFVKAYLQQAEPNHLIPKERANCQMLLELFLIDAALMEIEWELTYRPNWLIIPLRFVLRQLGEVTE